MNDQSYTTTFTVDQSPEQAFAAINNVRGWWSEEIEGPTDKLGEAFDYHYKDVHRCKMQITDLIPGRKVVWRVVDNHFSFTEDKTEWKDTTIVFEISKRGDKTEIHFTHLGLVPEYECFDVCSDGWTAYIDGSLRALMTTGKGHPNVGEAITAGELKYQDFTTAFSVDRTPEAAFAAINDVRGWWSGDIDGNTAKLGDEFTYRYEDLHYSKQKITEFIPGKKVAWLVLDSRLNFVADKSEWNGTTIIFDIARKGDQTEIRFTHLGLVPHDECYGACSDAWSSYINGSLRSLMTTGKALA